jgi:hypothetical protein
MDALKALFKKRNHEFYDNIPFSNLLYNRSVLCRKFTDSQSKISEK